MDEFYIGDMVWVYDELEVREVKDIVPATKDDDPYLLFDDGYSVCTHFCQKDKRGSYANQAQIENVRQETAGQLRLFAKDGE